jgi:site-specific DNA recombinase
LTRELRQSPEDELRLQGQGMRAADERAKMMERHRRGKRHAARAGAVHVRRGAPSGDRDVPTSAGHGQARDALVADDARVIRQVFAWIGRDRLPIGHVCRRLTRAGELTRTGKTIWERSAVWGRLKTPASMGTAAFGKTRQGPRRPRLRAQRRRSLPPRRAVSSAAVPAEAWRSLPVPAIVEPELFAAVQEPWRANPRHARPARRGARSLRQGLVPCPPCGDADDGKRLSPSARQGPPRA